MRNKNLQPASPDLSAKTGTAEGMVSAEVVTKWLTAWENRDTTHSPAKYLHRGLNELLLQYGNDVEVAPSLFDRVFRPKNEREKVKRILVNVGDNWPSDQKYVVMSQMAGSEGKQIVAYPLYAPGQIGTVVTVPDYLDRSVQKYVIFESHYSTQSYHEGRLVDTNSRRIESLLSGWLTGARTC